MDRKSRPDYLRLLTPGMAAPPAAELASKDAENSDAEARMSGIGVLVAGGQALLRAGYRVLLKSDERVEVLGEAGTAEETVTLASPSVTDVARCIDSFDRAPMSWRALRSAMISMEIWQ